MLGIILIAASIAGALTFKYIFPSIGRLDSPVLPDQGTAIQRVACLVNSARRSALRNTELIGNIVNALPPHVKVVLMINDRKAFSVVSNPWPNRVSFLELPEDAYFTIWPQDPFVVLKEPEGTSSLLASAAFQRADDRLMAPSLAEDLGWAATNSSLRFEGGNLVADERHLFIGADTIGWNAVELDLSPTAVARRFEREMGRSVIVIGPSPQPIGHIDMMLTPLGNGTVALADPAWGARIASEELEKNPEKIEAFERFCMEEFFGHPSIREIRDLQGNIIKAPEIIGRTAEAVEKSRAIAPDLDSLAQALKERGYRVIRIPFISIGRPEPVESKEAGKDIANKTEKPAFEPDYPTLTYNNVLLETADGKQTVYLPQYGWEALDEAARKAWIAMGYSVQPVPGLTISAMYGGSLRCCVKVLERKNN